VKSDLQPLKIHRRQNVKKRELKNLRDGMSPEDRIGAWLSAALEDPMVCDEMKQDIKDWFDQTNDRIVRATDFECPRCGHCCQSEVEWVGLTEPELHEINPTWPAPGQHWNYEDVLAFARAVETKLKEKNT
jgi:hypothetical protein